MIAAVSGAVGALAGVLGAAVVGSDAEHTGNLAEWVSGLGTTFAFLVAVLVLRTELAARREEKKLETIRFVAERLQGNDEQRARRRVLYEKFSSGANVEDSNYWNAAEDSAQRLDVIGILVLEGVLDGELVQTYWGEQIARCYLASEAVIKARIDREAHRDIWRGFRELADQALSRGCGYEWQSLVLMRSEQSVSRWRTKAWGLVRHWLRESTTSSASAAFRSRWVAARKSGFES